jgi:protein-tyrosine kinase
MTAELPVVELTGRYLRTRELPMDAQYLRRSRLLAPGMQGIAAQSFKMLRTQVLQRLRAHRMNSLAIVSSTPGDGKTMVAINLAMAISMDPTHSALLVDFDLRHPSIARRLGILAEPGVEECLMGARGVSDVFVRLAGYERLMVLPAANPVVDSSELLGSETTRQIVHELKHRYTDRIAVFDLPPLLGADDALAFLPQVDAALLVVSEGHTRSEHLARALELLKDKPVIGTVLNRARSDAANSYVY